nr:hypothetical protein [Clostridioides sp.]
MNSEITIDNLDTYLSNRDCKTCTLERLCDNIQAFIQGHDGTLCKYLKDNLIDENEY